jgi:hypothetical protein
MFTGLVRALDDLTELALATARTPAGVSGSAFPDDGPTVDSTSSMIAEAYAKTKPLHQTDTWMYWITHATCNSQNFSS